MLQRGMRKRKAEGQKKLKRRKGIKEGDITERAEKEEEAYILVRNFGVQIF